MSTTYGHKTSISSGLLAIRREFPMGGCGVADHANRGAHSSRCSGFPCRALQSVSCSPNQHQRTLHSRCLAGLQLVCNCLEAIVQDSCRGADLFALITRQAGSIDAQLFGECRLGICTPSRLQEFSLRSGKVVLNHVAIIAHKCYNCTYGNLTSARYDSGAEGAWHERIN